jgi:hypothetical protein
MSSLLFFITFSCMVPLPRDVRPPAIPSMVVFCIGVGWFEKSSRHGVTQQDVTESISACVISCVEALLAINITILSSALI